MLKGLEDEEESTKKTKRKRLEWEEANIVRNDHFFRKYIRKEEWSKEVIVTLERDNRRFFF